MSCARAVARGLLGTVLMAHPCLSAALFVLCVATSSRAQAQDEPEPTRAPEKTQAAPTKSEWYGGYILGVDAIGIATMPIGVGLGVYALGGPIVHLTKAKPGAAAASLGLRVGMPFVLGTGGLLVGAYACNKSDNPDDLSCLFGVAFGGAIIGALGAIAIDAAALARHQVPATPETKAGITYAPSFVVARDRALVTLGGTF